MSKIILKPVASSSIATPLPGKMTLFLDNADNHFKAKFTNGSLKKIMYEEDLIAGLAPELLFFTNTLGFPPVGDPDLFYIDKSNDIIYRWDTGTTSYHTLGSQDDVLFFATFAAFPLVGVDGVIYVDKSGDLSYRWDTGTTSYHALGSTPELLFFATFAAFPPTGAAGFLYIDKALNDIYRWDTVTSAYVMLGSDAVANRYFIPAGMVVKVPANFQYFIYGNLTIEGELINDGQVVIVNGGMLFQGAGSFTNNGSFQMVDLVQVGGNNNYSEDFSYPGSVAGTITAVNQGLGRFTLGGAITSIFNGDTVVVSYLGTPTEFSVLSTAPNGPDTDVFVAEPLPSNTLGDYTLPKWGTKNVLTPIVIDPTKGVIAQVFDSVGVQIFPRTQVLTSTVTINFFSPQPGSCRAVIQGRL